MPTPRGRMSSADLIVDAGCIERQRSSQVSDTSAGNEYTHSIQFAATACLHASRPVRH